MPKPRPTVRERLSDLACDDGDAQMVADKAVSLFRLTTLEDPPGYWHGSLCIVDSIWSISSHYGAAKNVVARYCAYRGIENLSFARGSEICTGEDTIQDFMLCAQLDHGGFVTAIDNRNRTSSTNGILKSDAAIQLAEALVAEGICVRADLSDESMDLPGLETWIAVQGQGTGISYIYARILAGADDVKPDRQVLRFVGECLGRNVDDPYRARAIFRRAVELLRDAHPDLKIAALDYAVWRHQSKSVSGETMINESA